MASPLPQTPSPTTPNNNSDFQLDLTRLRQLTDNSVILKITRLAIGLNTFSKNFQERGYEDDSSDFCLYSPRTEILQFQTSAEETFKYRKPIIKEKEVELSDEPDPYFPDLVKIDLVLGNALTTLAYLQADFSSLTEFRCIAKQCSKQSPIPNAHLYLQNNFQLFADLMKTSYETLQKIHPKENNRSIWTQSQSLINKIRDLIDQRFIQPAEQILKDWENRR